MSNMHPIIVNLPSGTHRICTCGESMTAPICDDSEGPPCRKAPSITLEAAKTVPICACGRTQTAPICDGSHGYEKNKFR
jgi:CDGSH iron-sulfur domain-containing protein 3